MKKVIFGLIFLIVLAIVSVYIFIPKRINIAAATVIKMAPAALYRYLSDEEQWQKWWPVSYQQKRVTDQNNHPVLNEFSYRLSKKLYNAADVEILKNNEVVNGKIFLIPITTDSLIVRWQSVLATSLNPFTRISQYYRAVSIKKNMDVLLHNLKLFGENKNKVYKFSINYATITDTTFVAIKNVTKEYPSTKEIYRLVENLKTYVKSQNAKDVNYPILNISEDETLGYNVMVAIATDKPLSGKGNIAFKRMIAYKDKILTADVTGGPAKIKQAHDELNIFMKDYNLASPVIGWETLITDRLKETDSTKWITKICIPIV